MTDWVITFTFDADPMPETMDEWETRLEGFDASVARIPDRGIDVTVYAPGHLGIADALGKLEGEVMHVVQAGSPVGAEIVTETQHRHRAAAYTMPELMSAAEIAEELKISRQRVHQLRSATGFPAPLADLRGGAVWDAAAVRQFVQTWERKPGRPHSGSVTGGFSFQATEIRGRRPQDVRWRIEQRSKNRFVVRNVGDNIAENVEIDDSRIGAITRNVKPVVAVAPGEGFDLTMAAAWGAPLPNQLYLRWVGQDDWVAVPLEVSHHFGELRG